MRLLYQLAGLWRFPTVEEAIQEGDWAELLRVLSKCEDLVEIVRLKEAIGKIGDRQAVRPLLKFAVENYHKAIEMEARAQQASSDPSALLSQRLRSQTNVLAVGYNPGAIRSPITDFSAQANWHYARKNAALEALVDLGAADQIQAIIDNPQTPEKMRISFKNNLAHFVEKHPV